MPSYDYTCDGGHVFTETRSINAEPSTTVCLVEGCGKNLNRLWQATPVSFKGSGFYSKDKDTGLLKNGQKVDW